jgi:hypothetical protein
MLAQMCVVCRNLALHSIIQYNTTQYYILLYSIIYHCIFFYFIIHIGTGVYIPAQLVTLVPVNAGYQAHVPGLYYQSKGWFHIK